MTEDATIYELYAIRYAGNPRRHRGHNYIMADDPERLEPMDYFSWVAVGPSGAIVIDTGLRREKALQRGYDYVRPPHAILPSLGVDPAAVKTVILTHMHYDHIGNLDAFPHARFHLQSAEMAYAVSPLMAKPWFRLAYEVDEIQRCVAYLHEGRLDLHAPEAEIAPGMTVHLVGGHCAGQEVVRVRTRRGWVVLASDALHYYEELDKSIPFAVAHSIADMMLAHDRIMQLATSPDHIVPSHDPQLMSRYPAPRPGLEGLVVRLDVPPIPS
ncbi:N-acyl homoserine lactonase family protein [Acidisphaera sp. L21]|uniref:N-acyl homoserine lactonase family protein n=1 Tax=Acidisphaera sp. L21 TaxID=1641851 RepID=UPI00131E7C9A|nr:N-acyl homoserine lactonase family protein [Acidisphaera sp. L21]